MKYKIGKGSKVDKFVLVGCQPKQKTKPPVIGDKANIRSHTVIYAGNIIGDNFQTGHGVLIRELNTIGNDVSIGSHAVVEHHVTIGDNVRIHSNAFIPEYTVLEDNVWIGPAVILTNAKYPASPKAKESLTGVVVKNKAKIGAGAVILPGVVIGKNALIGAGSVVTKDVPEDSVVVGNPAKVITSLSKLKYESGGKVYP